MRPVDDTTDYEYNCLGDRAKSAPRKASGKLNRVLVVDSDQTLRKSIDRVFHARGIEAIFAQDGEEGLALFQILGGAVDVVLLDKDMPKMDGLATLTSMMKLHSHIPVVVYSRENDPQWAKVAMRLGAKATVQKPLMLEELLVQLGLLVTNRPLLSHSDGR